MTARVATIVFAVFSVLSMLSACEKKREAPLDVFMIDSSPDDVFSRVVSQLQVQGFDIDQFEKRDRTVKTAWKEIPVSEVETFAKLKEPAERYEKGRLAYQAKVEADGDNSRLFIDALVEALYTPHQRESEKFGIDKEWQAAKSNGSAERSFMDSIK